MKVTRQRILMVMMVILVMTLSLFNTGIAFADDQPPVEPAITEEPVVIDPPSETEEPIATDTPAVESESISTEEMEQKEAGVQEIFEQIPAETKVVALNEEGQPEPLVTQQAAEILISGDPVWCPATLSAPTPGANGCTASYSSFQDLLIYLDANEVAQDGTIWIESSFMDATQN
jgi:hypothetical protein